MNRARHLDEAGRLCHRIREYVMIRDAKQIQIGEAYFQHIYVLEGTKLWQEFCAATERLLSLSPATAFAKAWLLNEIKNSFLNFEDEEMMMKTIGRPDKAGWNFWILDPPQYLAKAEEKIFCRAVTRTCVKVLGECSWRCMYPPMVEEGRFVPDILKALAHVVGEEGSRVRGRVSSESVAQVKDLRIWSAELIRSYGDGVVSHYAALKRLDHFLRSDDPF